jgi:hypothetical protein
MILTANIGGIVQAFDLSPLWFSEKLTQDKLPCFSQERATGSLMGLFHGFER